MTLGAIIGNAAFAASDCRVNNYTRRERVDQGGKLVRIPNGWATSSGHAGIAFRGLRALAEDDGATLKQLVHEAAERDRRGIRGHTQFTVVHDAGAIRVIEIGERGGVYDPDPYAFSFPPGLSDEQKQAVTDRFLDAASTATSLTDCLRAIAGAFALVARQSSVKTVSSSIEIGITFQGRARHLRADSAELGRMSEKAISRLLREPPRLEVG